MYYFDLYLNSNNIIINIVLLLTLLIVYKVLMQLQVDQYKNSDLLNSQLLLNCINPNLILI